uniref:Uncharacterized protein n=1 Tax=Anguilla anguilla TaxID=7936 RepID=A0A0E9RKQ0_ANGAN
MVLLSFQFPLGPAFYIFFTSATETQTWFY